MIERIRGRVDLDRLGRAVPVHPNAITLASLAVALSGVPMVWLLSAPPIAFILASSVLDVLDGAVARSRGLVSPAGAFLDSVLDRASDAAFLLYFWPAVADKLAIFAALVGTFMVSYARCRGESLGARARGVGFMERGERVAYLAAASLLPGVAGPAISIYALLVNAAAIYRAALLFLQLRTYKRSPEGGP